MFDLPKFPKHKLVVQANGPIPKSLYEKAARIREVVGRAARGERGGSVVD